MEPLQLVYVISFFTVAIAFAYAVYLHFWVKGQPAANARILEVSGLIRAGANTFMRKEYVILARFAGIAALLILILLPSPIWNRQMGLGLFAAPGCACTIDKFAP